MKKRVLALILCAVMLLLCIAPSGFAETERAARYLEINEANFPDADLRAWIIGHISVSGSASGGYYMTEAQATGVNVISISGFDEVNGEELYLKKISLEGLQLFPNLEEIYLDYIELKPFRFGRLNGLKTLYCEQVYLADVDCSGCPALETIRWDWGKSDGRKIKSIDCSDCPDLKSVVINAQKANVKNCAKLETLLLLEYAYSGYPIGIAQNVETCPALRHLYCRVDGTIDLTKNTALLALALDGTIDSLDLSKNTALRQLSIGSEAYADDLEEMDRAARSASGFDTRSAGGLKTLDLTHNTALESLTVCSDTLTSLIVSPNTVLTNAVLKTAIPSIDMGSCTGLRSLHIGGTTETVDLSRNVQLDRLYLDGQYIRFPDLTANTELKTLSIRNGSMTEIEVKDNANLEELYITHTPIAALDLSGNPALQVLWCEYAELSELDLSGNPNLTSVNVGYNHLASIDLSGNPSLYSFSGYGQVVLLDEPMQETDGEYTYDLAALTDAAPSDIRDTYESYITVSSDEIERYDGISYDSATGVVTADRCLKTLCYKLSLPDNLSLHVKLLFPYEGEVRAEWTDEFYGENVYNDRCDQVGFKGDTPYMVFNENRAYEPTYRVVGDEDRILERGYFTGVFENNDAPGTAALTVTMKNTGKIASNWFKLYLPPTEKTDIANTKDGVALSWDPVSDARGYVIYRRAWSATTDGWTEFKRWNNTTDTAWTDTKVYAGTRYQYGVKAYYSDPMDNYNLGEVGPLKTTVRITTRTLLGVDAGTKQFTARWDGSKTVTGYQIKYATDANFKKNVGAVKVARPDAYRTTIKGLTSGTTYYVTVRGYQVFNGMTYFGEWSNVISCKVR